MNKQYVGVKLRNEMGTYSGKEYSFICQFKVKEGDFVVCDTSYGYSLGMVMTIADEVTALGKIINPLKEVVQVVDVSAFEKRQERNKELASLKKSMQKRLKEVSDMELFEKVATTSGDKVMLALLESYQALEETIKQDAQSAQGGIKNGNE